MFDESATKIKGLAKFVTAIGIIMAIIIGIVLLANSEEGYNYYSNSKIYDTTKITMGFLLIFVGPLLSWAGGLLIYGFGELIEKACRIEKKMQNGAQTDDASVMGSPTTDLENVTESTSTPTEEDTKEKP